jgi:hypothetical protein
MVRDCVWAYKAVGRWKSEPGNSVVEKWRHNSHGLTRRGTSHRIFVTTVCQTVILSSCLASSWDKHILDRASAEEMEWYRQPDRNVSFNSQLFYTIAYTMLDFLTEGNY